MSLFNMPLKNGTYSLLYNKLLRSLISVSFMLSVSCHTLSVLIVICICLTQPIVNCSQRTICTKIFFARLNAIERCKLWFMNRVRKKFMSSVYTTINAVSLNARGLNKSIKRRKLFRWLHIRKFDVIFLQETYSDASLENFWRAEWGGDIFSLTAQNIAEVL